MVESFDKELDTISAEASSVLDKVAESMGFPVPAGSHFQPLQETIEASILGPVEIKMNEEGQVSACVRDKCVPCGTGPDAFEGVKELLNVMSSLVPLYPESESKDG